MFLSVSASKERFLSVFIVMAVGLIQAQPLSLKKTPVPAVPGLNRYVRDPQSLIALGKALFWDMQVGSDNRTACGTCHFHAGADHRSRHQISRPAAPFHPNSNLGSDDFPFHLFANTADNRSAVLRDSASRVGSQGVFRRIFAGASAGEEAGVDVRDEAFRLGELNLRQVTPRNTPSVINSVFDVRTFRDGRASDVFSGRTPFGDSDREADILARANGELLREKVRLVNSSLASLATGPPVNTVEMAYQGRTWRDIARKLLPARPLSLQRVAAEDSVLGAYASTGKGLLPVHTYMSMVHAAFQPTYWDSSDSTMAEYNFPFFFGLAVQAYLSTLVSDDTPFDRFLDGDRNAMSADQTRGLLLFRTGRFCMSCHSGAEFTAASHSARSERGPVEQLVTGRGNTLRTLLVDTGFAHTGVRPVGDDAGLSALDDFGQPFSVAARSRIGSPLAIAGAFKAPGLRNVEFTGPYFHNGGQATLEQVIDFYSRGGDFPESPDLPSMMTPTPLTTTQRTQLVQFLKALSDDRVRYERAPFDHPEICVPIGYHEVPQRDPAFASSALDRWAGIPAVGASGNTVPLQTFEELLQGDGQGTRAHTLTDACSITTGP